MKEVFTILTSDDKKEIREAVKQMCLAQIKEDISSVYLVSKDDLIEIYQDVFEDLRDELKECIKEDYLSKLKDSILKSIG